MDCTTLNVTKAFLYILFATGLIGFPLLLYSIKNQSFTVCPTYFKTPNATVEKQEKPILLIWFLPVGISVNFTHCKTYFNIDSCVFTNDRSLYSVADGVVFYHRRIAWDLSNLPKEPRPAFQKWIWYNVESPSNTHRVAGLNDLFNLTMTYRRDLELTIRYELNIVRSQEKFVLPKKDKIVCWIASNNKALTRLRYYYELRKHINVNVYGRVISGAGFLRFEEYYSTMASCKFYLAFENSCHEDYMTEKLNGALASGTVPVVLGASRENYEQFIPADSFIHVNDFPNPKALAEYLLLLNQNDDLYMRYFAWRKYFRATPHLLRVRNEFTMPICAVCDHIAKDKSLSVFHDLFWWFHKNHKGRSWR